jgi:hypothetical protein
MEQMNAILEKLDTSKYIGIITLDTGGKLYLPKLTTGMVFRIAKLVASKGVTLYNQFKPVFNNKDLSDEDKMMTVITQLPEQMVFELVGTILGTSAKEVDELPLHHTIEVIETYVHKGDLKKSFDGIQKLTKVFAKQQPNPNTAGPVPVPEISNEPLNNSSSGWNL